MNMRWLMIAIAGLGLAGLLAAEPASARSRHKQPPACADRPAPFTWQGLFFNGKPQPNGCAPAVFQGSDYVGQDPDPNVRLQLRRDPNNGYTDNSR